MLPNVFQFHPLLHDIARLWNKAKIHNTGSIPTRESEVTVVEKFELEIDSVLRWEVFGYAQEYIFSVYVWASNAYLYGMVFSIAWNQEALLTNSVEPRKFIW